MSDKENDHFERSHQKDEEDIGYSHNLTAGGNSKDLGIIKEKIDPKIRVDKKVKLD